MSEIAKVEVVEQRLAPKKQHWCLPLLLLLAAVVYVSTSFTPVLFDETEGQYAGAAREMLQGGHWLVPTNDSLPRLQKPPLLYWFLCLSIGLFGQTEFAARLRKRLATIAWSWASYVVEEGLAGLRGDVTAAA